MEQEPPRRDFFVDLFGGSFRHGLLAIFFGGDFELPLPSNAQKGTLKKERKKSTGG
jgi:hypothetical protein